MGNDEGEKVSKKEAPNPSGIGRGIEGEHLIGTHQRGLDGPLLIKSSRILLAKTHDNEADLKMYSDLARDVQLQQMYAGHYSAFINVETDYNKFVALVETGSLQEGLTGLQKIESETLPSLMDDLIDESTENIDLLKLQEPSGS